MTNINTLIAQVNARGPVAGFTDTADDVELPSDVDRAEAKIFQSLRVGDLTLQHRVVHPALGRSRSAYGAESPLAAKYFAQRTTPGSLMISQATGVSDDSAAWQWAGSLDNDTQQAALSRVIQAVHDKGGYWFQQLFHVGRGTTPALVKLARERAGLKGPPPYGYLPVSSSAVAESGLNTHSGEHSGIPHALTIEEIHGIRNDFKRAAQRAVEAGADGIEVLAGNGWLIDQFLHDNINKRTDEYGGTVENRSRFALEVVDAVADVVGYQRVGIRLSPFSYFHETDGSQPLEQILYVCHHLVLRGIAYLHVGQGRITRNLDIEQNIRRLVAKGIPLEDISLRPFRRLLSRVRPTDPLITQTVLIGNGFNAVPGILAVEEGLADAVSFGRRFISNPDLVERLKFGYPLTPNNIVTFYTHGADGYTSYASYDSEQDSSSQNSIASDRVSEDTTSSSPISAQADKRVAIIGAGISGIVSAAALNRVGGFDVRIFECRGVPGGSWVLDGVSITEPRYPAADSELINPPLAKPAASLPVIVPRATQQRFHTTPLYFNLRANIPYKVMGEGSVFELPPPQDLKTPFLRGAEISAAVAKKAHQFDHLIEYHTTVEDVEKVPGGRLRLTLRKENPNDTDTWEEQEFDHLIVATGHNSVPRVPNIPGLDQWTRNLRHTVTWRSGEECRDQKILIVGSGESAIDVCLQSLPYAKGPVYISQRTPHPQYPRIFSRPGVDVVSTISRITTDVIHLTDGRTLTDIDTILFATGYLYTYPFLSPKIRPPPVAGYRVPSLYQHVFDMINPETIAFNGVVSGSLPWLTWEKSAFLIALLWSGKIHLPPREAQEAWETRRLAETGDRMFHVLAKPSERVIFFDELNELAAEYLHTENQDDVLLRSFPFKWVVELLKSRELQAEFYGITDNVLGIGSVGAPAIIT